jgi:proline racemase
MDLNNYKTFKKIQRNKNYPTQADWLSIKTIDMHTGGEPLRVILDGFPAIKGNNVLEARQYAKTNYDHLRKSLMFEPRGHADMYGCILIPPNDEGADFGILFLHNEGYSAMCGHAIIGITTLAVEMNWVDVTEPETKIVIDAPCGRITSFVKVESGEVKSVYFHGVPSFVVALDQTVEVPGLGVVEYDLAYGGAFYAYVNSEKLNIDLTPENSSLLIQKGMDIKHAVIKSNVRIEHPFEADLSFLYGTIFIGGPVSDGIDSRNVCIFADGEVDRSPTGSGVSGRLPIHFTRKEIAVEETMTIESITGSVFKGSVIRTEQFGKYEAIIPQVEGTAFVTGQHEFLINPNDPFKEGFFLR